MKKYFDLIVNSLLLITVFIGSLFFPTDPDLGWHLKYGEYFFKFHHILRDNTFSALMPNYHWNNSSWATDLLSYQVFHNFGFWGLSALGAFVITLTFFFISKAAKLNLFEKALIFPTLLYFVNQVNLVSFRGQLLSLLLLTVLYYILSIYKEKDKRIVLSLIPLFILWSNFHGEFIVGIAVLLMWTFVYLFKEVILVHKKNISKLIKDEKFLIISVIGSLFAVMINPFGVNVYLETIHHFGNPAIRSVTEYIPFIAFSQVWWNLIIAGTLCILGVILFGTNRKNSDLYPFAVVSIALFILSLWIRRYAWTFYYASVFLLKPVAHFLEPDSKKAAKTAALVISIVFLVGTIWSKQSLAEYSWDWQAFCRVSVTHCSDNGAKTVIENKLTEKNLLTIYDYGGWLIWNYPEIKPTIDGRMHLWKDEKGFSGFNYYFPIEQNRVDINETSYNAVLTSHVKPIYRELLEKTKEGSWVEIYEDDQTAVFVKR